MLQMPPVDPNTFFGLVGKSTRIKEVCEMLRKISPSDASVLIEGESGTGKELVARAIHFGSQRKNHEFVVVNCSAFSDSLLESELFGHMRGSFTGAIAEKKGLFEIADKGTFFLDEVGDMSPALQVKLLRVLQEGVFLKIGGISPVRVDVRIIAATNQNLKKFVKEGKFREDLYYRLNVMYLFLPPLRERKEDVPLLIDFISKKIAEKNGQEKKKISKAVMDLLENYDWPGNVRELENELEKAYILSEGETVESANLSRGILQIRTAKERDGSLQGGRSLKERKKELVTKLEKEMIELALVKHKGNQTKAAQELEISRQDLIRKLKLYKIS